MEGRRLYPIGIQTFSKLREGNYVYVDKTELVYRMTHGASGYIFLSRPRRFGKSLLTSTLHSYFEGRKELFEDLAIERLEKEWTRYPVLHFDMSTAKHMDKDRLLSELERKLYGYEQIYGRDESAIYYEPTSGKSHQTCLRPDRSKGGCLDRRVRRSLAGRGA